MRHTLANKSFLLLINWWFICGFSKSMKKKKDFLFELTYIIVHEIDVKHIDRPRLQFNLIYLLYIISIEWFSFFFFSKCHLVYLICIKFFMNLKWISWNCILIYLRVYFSSFFSFCLKSFLISSYIKCLLWAYVPLHDFMLCYYLFK